jgi:hypothetical protein
VAVRISDSARTSIMAAGLSDDDRLSSDGVAVGHSEDGAPKF